MASAQGIRAGEAFVELFADDSRLVQRLERGLQAAQGRGARASPTIGKKMLAGGMTVLGALAGVGQGVCRHGQPACRHEPRTGVSVEALSELGYAAEMSGADMETLEGGLRKMQKTIVGGRLGLAVGPGGPGVAGDYPGRSEGPVARRAVHADRRSAGPDPESHPARGGGDGGVRQVGHQATAHDGRRREGAGGDASEGPGLGPDDRQQRRRRGGRRLGRHAGQPVESRSRWACSPSARRWRRALATWPGESWRVIKTVSDWIRQNKDVSSPCSR